MPYLSTCVQQMDNVLDNVTDISQPNLYMAFPVFPQEHKDRNVTVEVLF